MSLLEVKIYYEDTDCGGVVYHANYLRYCERARTEYFADRGIVMRDCMNQGIVFVVARAEVRFEAPACYGDVLEIESTISEVRKVSFSFNHTIRRKGESLILARACVKLGCINGERKPIRIPAEVLTVMNEP
ncbi:MAG TPA: YbgC/FadM family acyl-CoA thioesterase [Thermodesulfobacteriota bacterium]|nr:YbgC/FadM family acyl-CoA thioesterase [Deltaproteobacteria bacterium]HNR13123.1 YbgC/FadM family acyl-CoA thioesterase [Thermodesulfobacteriota bacterium]HNU70758.1 YbgC/FadM family acyl-CoA thioesterase [Thermodesulfobacteriota bacterium]HOC37798.1 YbgC/FadM family acyl-CoA thioesterase [Thermodesulfobacteriota bacterium]